MAKEFETTKNALLVRLAGEIDQYAAAELKTRIDLEIRCSAKKNIIMDLSLVTMMDSSGIGLIVGRYKTAQSLGGNLAVCGASATIEKVINLSGIRKVIECFESAEEADIYLKNFHGGERNKRV